MGERLCRPARPTVGLEGDSELCSMHAKVWNELGL